MNKMQTEIIHPGGKTVVNRLAAYCRKNGNSFNISIEDKQAIGRIILDKFYEDGKKHALGRTAVREPEGTFRVLVYPSYFVSVMDALIIKYFAGKEVPRPNYPLPVEEK